MNLTNVQRTIIANRHARHNINIIEHPKLDFLKDMYKLKDMREAGELIAKHVTDKSHIAHVHDYDCDGINSGVVLNKGFKNQLQHDNITMFCNKRRDGNGINDTLFDRIATVHNQTPIDLIVMSDHGSSDEKNISRLVALGIDVCLTDHHTIPNDNYPKSATVFVNPERHDNEIHLPISGCFVAFLVVVSAYEALHGSIDNVEVFNDLLPFVAITTISDVMPLNLPINRAVVDVGFKEMNSFRNRLWLVFKRIFSINTLMDHITVGFVIAPLINTGNRIGVEELAYQVLISEDPAEAAKLINQLIKYSDIRKTEQKKLYTQAAIQADLLPYKNSVVVMLDTELSINGVIAGQIGEAYRKPTICFVDHGSNIISGSARGINKEVNIVELFNDIKRLHPGIIIKAGGHKQAGGCAIYKDKFEEFRKYVDELVPKATPATPLHIDMELSPSDITPALMSELDIFKPYGKDYDRPIFHSRLRIGNIMVFGNVMKVVFNYKNRGLEGIYFANSHSTFDPAEAKTYFKQGEMVDVIYGLEFSNFAGSITLQLKIIDIKKQGNS